MEKQEGSSLYKSNFSVEGRPPEEVLGETIDRLARTWETESCRQGIAAFLEKRKPPWISEKIDGT